MSAIESDERLEVTTSPEAVPETVIHLLLERVENSERAEVRATLLAHVAQLYEHELDDPDRALTALLAAEAERDADEAGADLERLAARTGRWSDLIDHLACRLPTLADSERADGCARLGELCFAHLAEPERALVAANAALAIEPHHERALQLRLEVLRTLDRAGELVEALGAAASASWDVERRVVLHLEQASLLVQLGDQVRAKEACRSALDADPEASEAVALLETLVRKSAETGEVDELLALLDARVVVALEPLPLRREAAALCAARGRSDEAIRRYEALRVEVPADLETIEALARLYEGVRPREHLELLAVLGNTVTQAAERLAIQRRLCAGWEALGEPGRAADALEWILAGDGGDDASFAKLAELYRADGRWRAAVVAISRRLERAALTARAPLYVELGMLFEEHAEDDWRAIDYYENANELAPGVDTTLVALGRLYERTSSYERAAKRLEEAARIARTSLARVGRLTRGAELLLMERDEARVEWAARLLREALVVQPGYPPAACALARLHLERSQGREAADLLAGAVALAADDDERADLLLELGRIEESLGEEERALACYRRALEADPDRRDAQVHASDMLYRLGFDHEVIPLLERLCQDEPDAAVRADRLVRLGRVYEAIGDRGRALEAVHHAQAVAPTHFAARRFEGELLFAEGRWRAAREIFESVVAEGATLTSREQANLQARIGACAIALADSHAALTALEQALRLNPDHLVALKRALEIYAEQGRWLEALAAAERIATVEPEKKLRARYRGIAGRICMDELSAPEDAIAHYRAALDEDPALETASNNLERLLLLQGDSAALVAHYTQRIQRLGASSGPAEAERVRLWAALADACESMGDKEAHRLALEVASRLDGSRLDLHERYAEACTQVGVDQVGHAIVAHQEILARDKGRSSSYVTLAALYARTGDLGRAAACRRAAALLGALGLKSGLAFDTTIDEALDETPLPARRPLSAQDWARLRHGDEDPRLSALWARLAPILVAQEATPGRAQGLRPKDAVRGDDGRPFAIACREASRLLGVAAPVLHVRSEQRHALAFVNARSEHALTPTFLVGTPLLGDRRRPDDLLFTLALSLANLSAERLLRLALPDASALTVVLEAVTALAHEADGKGSAAWSRIGQALRRHMTPLAFDHAVVVGRALAGHDVGALTTRWLRGVDLTAGRAALIVSGDLRGAVRGIDRDERPSCAGTDERLLDLIWFSVTDTYASIRAQVAGGEAFARVAAPRRLAS